MILYIENYKESTRKLIQLIRNSAKALAGVAQWIEHGPANQRVTGSIPRPGHMGGLQSRSPVGGT